MGNYPGTGITPRVGARSENDARAAGKTAAGGQSLGRGDKEHLYRTRYPESAREI